MMSATIIKLVVFVGIFAYSSPCCTAQPNAILAPKMQNVCPGEIVYCTCNASGSLMDIYCPPVVNESNALTLLARDPVGTVLEDSWATLESVQSTEDLSFMGRLTLNIPNEQSPDTLSVICRVTTADSRSVTDSATFLMSGKPNPATTYTYSQVQNECKEGTAVSVNMFWNFPENTEEFILQLKSMNYNTTVYSTVNKTTVLLPRGMYLATLCTKNRCGQSCQNYSNVEIDCNSQLETGSATTDVKIIALPIVITVVIVGAIAIFVISTTVCMCMKKKDEHKPNNDSEAISTKVE